jgi:hypothetical protein
MTDEDRKSIAAKNLLLGHDCSNCHFFHNLAPGQWCEKYQLSPEEKTCELWEEVDFERRMTELWTQGMQKSIDDQVKKVVNSYYAQHLTTAVGDALKELLKTLGMNEDGTRQDS